METSVAIAAISAVGSAIAAALSYLFSRRREVESEWRNQKLTHYKELLAALSDAAIHGIKQARAQERFANAFNTVALVAPQSVIDALLTFHDEIAVSNPNPSLEQHDRLLAELMYRLERTLVSHPLTIQNHFAFV